MINVEKRLKIDEAVRKCIGTQWVHQGRVPGLALDCIGLAIEAAKAAGDWNDGLNSQIGNYGTIPHRNRFWAFMNDNLVEVPKDTILPGDLLLMTMRSFPMHIGVLSSLRAGTMSPPWSLIHAMAEMVKRVVEEPLTNRLAVHSCWRFPSLAREEVG